MGLISSRNQFLSVQAFVDYNKCNVMKRFGHNTTIWSVEWFTFVGFIRNLCRSIHRCIRRIIKQVRSYLATISSLCPICCHAVEILRKRTKQAKCAIMREHNKKHVFSFAPAVSIFSCWPKFGFSTHAEIRAFPRNFLSVNTGRWMR